MGAEAIYSTPPSVAPRTIRRRVTSWSELGIGVCDRVIARSKEVRFPSKKWERDPVAFAREVFGVELWAAQIKIIESIRDNRNTTVRSGHKVGKSKALAVAALWFFCTFDDARVILTAVKSKQIDEVIWREIRALYLAAKKRGYDLGELFIKASAGLRAPDGRQIVGLTAQQAEGNAGISGANILLLVDEASGVSDLTFEVLGSSLAGSGGVTRKCYISNPTKTFGEFYRSHTSNKHLFSCIHISSENTPNALGLATIPGLAGQDWIEERRAEYGVESPQYKIRVKGEFVVGEDGKILSGEVITNAEARWEEAEAVGRLFIGVDPAGDGQGGDASAFAVRRGAKVLKVYKRQSITEQGHIAEIRGIISEFRRPGDELPIVVLDRDGEVGWKTLRAIKGYLDAQESAEFVLVAFRSGVPTKKGGRYLFSRDTLYAGAQQWMKTGAIPTDPELNADLHAASWEPSKLGDLHTATDKKALRKILGRSPDKGDAVLLSLYVPNSFQENDTGKSSAQPVAETAPSAEAYEPAAPVDPWSALGAWGDR